MKKKIIFIIVFAMIITLFTSCGRKSEKNGKNGFNIVTSFYPMYIFTSNITNRIEGISVKNMAGQDVGCLHDYQLLPEDMKIIADADVFVANGAGMESFMDKIVRERPKLKIVEASRGIKFIRDKNGEGNEKNSHVWLSVPLAVTEIKNIVEALEEYDPLHAQEYKNNANAYIERLNELHDEIKRDLKDIRGSSVMIFHEAFTYFAEEYGLYIAGVVEAEEGSEPGSQELINIIENIKEKNVKAIFVAPQHSSSALNTIRSQTGVPVYELNPIVFGDEDLYSYEKVMRDNKRVLLEALK